MAHINNLYSQPLPMIRERIMPRGPVRRIDSGEERFGKIVEDLRKSGKLYEGLDIEAARERAHEENLAAVLDRRFGIS
jgi:hypothetical protein